MLSSISGGNMDILVATVLGVALVIASYTDLKSQRIRNWLTFPLILSGPVAHFVFGGVDGLLLSGGGFALGLALMLLPFMFGVMGAGDVKLMAGVGAWLGVSATFTAFLITCFAGGVYALVVMARHRDYFKAVWLNIKSTFLMFMTTRKLEYTPTPSETPLPRLCYGVAIAIGSAAAMAVHYYETGSVFG